MDKAYKEIDNALTGEVERSELTAKCFYKMQF